MLTEKLYSGLRVCYYDEGRKLRNYGVVSSWNSSYVFVRFKPNGQAQACSRETLSLSNSIERTVKVFIDDYHKAPSGWLLARSYVEAVDTIDKHWDNLQAISFDYNIGNDGKNGLTIATWINEQHLQLPGGIFLNSHSSDYGGAESILRCLRAHVEMHGPPDASFGNLKVHLLDSWKPEAIV